MGSSDDEKPRAAEREAKKAKKEKKEKKEKKSSDGGDEGDEKRPTATPVEIHTLFFGQMPFDTKSSDIMPWLKANLTRHGCGFDIKDIRMAGGDGTGTPGKAKKFKGYAFVDFTTNKAAKKAMKLHQTLFRGRPVTVERCARKEYAAPKSEKRKRAAEGGGEGADGEPEKKMLKTLVEPDAVKAMVAEAAENSEGTLAANDCDEKVLSFLGLLPSDVCQKAVNEIKKVCMKGNQAKNKGAYFMGSDRLFHMCSFFLNIHAMIIDPAITMRSDLMSVFQCLFDHLWMSLHRHRHSKKRDRNFSCSKQI